MNRLTTQQQARVIAALVEGNSVRATVRMTDVAKNTIQKLVLDLGAACASYADEHLRHLPCRRIECDEVWSFCYAKAKNVHEDKRGQFGFGDVWTWVALDADTKLVCSWLVGNRDAGCAYEFYLQGTLVIPGQKIDFVVQDATIVGYDTDTSALEDLAVGDGARLDAVLTDPDTGQLVLKADIGIVDVVWQRKRERVDKIQQLSAAKSVDLSAMDEEFKGVLREVQ